VTSTFASPLTTKSGTRSINPERYLVQRGDTLWRIAARFSLDVNELARINNLSKAQQHWLSIGQQLRLVGSPAIDPSMVCVTLVDASGFPIADASLKLVYKGGEHHLQTNAQGACSVVQISTPDNGFRVELLNIQSDWELIHQVPALMPGLWRYRLTSGDILIKYVLRHDTGVVRDTPTILIHDISQTTQRHIREQARSTPKLISEGVKPTVAQMPTADRRETREARGVATTTVALYRTEGGLKLDAANSAWHDDILNASKRHALEPWFIAAVVEIECAKKMKAISRVTRSGELESIRTSCWDTDAGDPMSDLAVGICQFQYPAWLDVACNPASHLHETLCQRFGSKTLRHDAASGIFPKNKHSRRVLFTDSGTPIDEAHYKPLRKQPLFAIDGAAAYLQHNLKIALKDSAFSKAFHAINRTEQLMVCYACFNLGRRAAMTLLFERWSEISQFVGKRKDLTTATDQQILTEFCRQGTVGSEEKTLLTLTWSQRFDLRRFMADPSSHMAGSILRILQVFADAASNIRTTGPHAGGHSMPQLTTTPRVQSVKIEKEVGVKDHAALSTKASHLAQTAQVPLAAPQPVPVGVLTPPTASLSVPQAAQSGQTHVSLAKDTKPLPVTITTILKRNPGVGWERDAAHKPRIYSPPLSMPLKMRVRAPGGAAGGVAFKVSKACVGLERIDNGKPRWHTGIDFATAPGTKVLTPFSGWVAGLKTDPKGFGHYLILRYQSADLPSAPRAYLRHLGVTQFDLLFAHLDDDGLFISRSIVNTFVLAGTVIGIAGSSGNARGMTDENTGMHLHLEARVDGKIFDPLPLFPAGEIKDACRVYRFNALHFPQTYEPFECLMTPCKGCAIESRSVSAYAPPSRAGFHTQIPPQLMDPKRSTLAAVGG
jgi:murein DD-endopeptidase MepM/ murein hydrolase activator NlpD